jgi:biopolymer transport protein ExbD
MRSFCLVVFVMVVACLAQVPRGMWAIEVGVINELTEVHGDGCGPRPVLLHVMQDEAWVGEQGKPPQRVRSDAGLTLVLRRLKSERPDRELVVVQVDDGVSFGWCVHVLDLLAREAFVAVRIQLEQN